MYIMSSMCMYQGLGQMLTMRLQHHQGCSETPKCAYVIYGQPLTSNKTGLKLSQCALNWKMKRQMVCLLSDRQEQLTSPSLCLCLFVFTNRSFLHTRRFLSFFPPALCLGGQACSSPFSSEEF